MTVMNKASIAAATTVTKNPTVLDLHDQEDDFASGPKDSGRRSALNKSNSKFGLSAPPRSLNTSMGIYSKKKSREVLSPKDGTSFNRSVSKVSVSQQKQILYDQNKTNAVLLHSNKHYGGQYYEEDI
jgi:hypothetical protein